MDKEQNLSAAHRKEAAALYGPTMPGEKLEEAARASRLTFVRSQSHVGFMNVYATGRVLTAFESLYAFGRQTMARLGEQDPVSFVHREFTPATVIKQRREAFGVSPEDVAAGLTRRLRPTSIEEITEAELGQTKLSVRLLMAVVQALALDSWRIGAAALGGADAQLIGALRHLKESGWRLSAETVLDLAEAAWIIATQSRLEGWLNPPRPAAPRGSQIAAIDSQSARLEGYVLASRTRAELGIDPCVPIDDLVGLLEERLNIPVIRMGFDIRLAGAAILNGDSAGIVVNTSAGLHKKLGPFRVTLAHELCHILWDLPTDMEPLCVDAVAANEEDDPAGSLIEIRAQAFAAEFLAPRQAAFDIFRKAERPALGLKDVMLRFGVSFTCARNQVNNGAADKLLGRKLRFLTIKDVPDEQDVVPAVSPFEATPERRSGRFADLCVLAFEENLISADTAAEFLMTDKVAFEKLTGRQAPSP